VHEKCPFFDIVPVVRSRAGGSDEEWRSLCYDTHPVWGKSLVKPLFGVSAKQEIDMRPTQGDGYEV
jgi:hypothetical protein